MPRRRRNQGSRRGSGGKQQRDSDALAAELANSIIEVDNALLLLGDETLLHHTALDEIARATGFAGDANADIRSALQERLLSSSSSSSFNPFNIASSVVAFARGSGIQHTIGIPRSVLERQRLEEEQANEKQQPLQSTDVAFPTVPTTQPGRDDNNDDGDGDVDVDKKRPPSPPPPDSLFVLPNVPLTDPVGGDVTQQQQEQQQAQQQSQENAESEDDELQRRLDALKAQDTAAATPPAAKPSAPTHVQPPANTTEQVPGTFLVKDKKTGLLLCLNPDDTTNGPSESDGGCLTRTYIDFFEGTDIPGDRPIINPAVVTLFKDMLLWPRAYARKNELNFPSEQHYFVLREKDMPRGASEAPDCRPRVALQNLQILDLTNDTFAFFAARLSHGTIEGLVGGGFDVDDYSTLGRLGFKQARTGDQLESIDAANRAYNANIVYIMTVLSKTPMAVYDPASEDLLVAAVPHLIALFDLTTNGRHKVDGVVLSLGRDRFKGHATSVVILSPDALNNRTALVGERLGDSPFVTCKSAEDYVREQQSRYFGDATKAAAPGGTGQDMSRLNRGFCDERFSCAIPTELHIGENKLAFAILPEMLAMYTPSGSMTGPEQEPMPTRPFWASVDDLDMIMGENTAAVAMYPHRPLRLLDLRRSADNAPFAALNALKSLYGAINEQPDAVIDVMAAKKLEMLEQDFGQEGLLGASEELVQLLADLTQRISYNSAPPCDGWIIDARISDATFVATVMLFDGVGVSKLLQFWQAAQAGGNEYAQHAMPEIGTQALNFFDPGRPSS